MTSEERRLRDRIEELEEQVCQLKKLLIPMVPAPCQMSKALYSLFCALSVGGMVRIDTLRMAVEVRGDLTTPNNLSVQIYKLREKIEPLGYKIVTHRGFGFTMIPPVSPT